MSGYHKIVRPIAFRFDAEKVHHLAMAAIARGLIKSDLVADPTLEREFFGQKFLNPLGLAAGFDKNAVALNSWHKLGFGFVEIGTVTFHPQPGNPKPRVFRLAEDQALINRLGFNNDGAEVIARRLEQASPKIPYGVNIGKSKVADLGQAAEDYSSSFQILERFGCYTAINVSSPNTPGLRNLQEPEHLKEIIKSLKQINSSQPLIVKLAPDLEDSAIDELIDLCVEVGVSGIIATNTTTSRSGLKSRSSEVGGLSGLPLRTRSDQVLTRIVKRSPQNFVKIGVGGVMNGDDLYRKLQLGADLVQVYTGWIYHGPDFVPRCLERLITLTGRSR